MKKKIEILELTRAAFGSIESGCDVAVAVAVEEFLREISPSHSLVSKKYSLQGLAKKRLDEAVVDFCRRAAFVSQPPPFSELLTSKEQDAYQYWSSLWRKYEAQCQEKGCKPEQRVARTLDTIINMVMLCQSRSAWDTQDVTEDETGFAFRVRGKRSRGEGKQIAGKLPWYLLFDHIPYCELCHVKTELELEKLRLVKASSNDAEGLSLFRNHKFRSKGFSNRYCCKHNPSQDIRGYKKGHQNRKFYYSVMRLMIEGRRCLGLPPLEPEVVMYKAYNLVENHVDRLFLKRCVGVVASYYEAGLEKSDRRQMLVTCYLELVPHLPAEDFPFDEGILSEAKPVKHEG
ncbi:MAG: hypothetical protein KGI54_16340 [Pseudomonadota bacterium]|nr:hypothetical protein [Pseudomonadota bacterium]